MNASNVAFGFTTTDRRVSTDVYLKELQGNRTAQSFTDRFLGAIAPSTQTYDS